MKASSSKKQRPVAHAKAPGREAAGGNARSKKPAAARVALGAQPDGKPDKPEKKALAKGPGASLRRTAPVEVERSAEPARPGLVPRPDRGPPPPLPTPIATFNI